MHNGNSKPRISRAAAYDQPDQLYSSREDWWARSLPRGTPCTVDLSSRLSSRLSLRLVSAWVSAMTMPCREISERGCWFCRRWGGCFEDGLRPWWGKRGRGPNQDTVHTRWLLARLICLLLRPNGLLRCRSGSGTTASTLIGHGAERTGASAVPQCLQRFCRYFLKVLFAGAFRFWPPPHHLPSLSVYRQAGTDIDWPKC